MKSNIYPMEIFKTYEMEIQQQEQNTVGPSLN